ncbi:MAG: aromatic amino acid lyase [Acidobacteria bacterium]|nr:aromatic amino acid lyase [Acidobacteriota bacterium]
MTGRWKWNLIRLRIIRFSSPPATAALVRHGGNFYGLPVALASDSLNLAVLQLALTSERRTARVCDPTLNKGLPAFLQPRQNGVQSGVMGAQVTATALVAEMRTEAIPASIQSIPTNNNNQDVVPMGTIAARKVSRSLCSLYHILAIEAIAHSQAYDEINCAQFGSASASFVRWIRKHVPTIFTDRPLAPDIARLAAEFQADNELTHELTHESVLFS